MKYRIYKLTDGRMHRRKNARTDRGRTTRIHNAFRPSTTYGGQRYNKPLWISVVLRFRI